MANRTTCRICATPLPAPFLDFGAMPLANAFLRASDEFAGERSYPLAVALCAECGLVQLDYVVPADQLYREYIYVSSTSDAVRAYAEHLAGSLIGRYRWGADHLVVEVASNDGTILKAFQRRGVQVLGIEPARNIAQLALSNGVPTLPEFFTEAVGCQQRERTGPAAAIIGRHVFAHVDDVHDFLCGATGLLAKDGVLILEVPYLGDLLDKLEFDTIYHEHLSYFSLRPVEWLCRDRGLRLVDVEPVSLHGGSVVLHICRQDSPHRPSECLQAMLRREEERGFAHAEVMAAFAGRVQAWKGQFEGFIESLHRSGANLVGYGAAAKANTLLNYCPDAARAMRLILDKNPLKHGRYTPGTHLRVEPVERWAEDRVTHLVVLAWNFKEEIIRQMKPFADRGGRFVIPIPVPEII